jgi:hypothetical protein
MITAERLRQLIVYDPSTGLITRPNGETLPNTPLARIRLGEYGAYRANRLAWLYMTGEWPARSVSYRDNDPANLRWVNLRLASPRQTAHGRKARNKLGVKGVRETPNGNFRASIHVNGRTLSLGTFTTKEGAVEAYATAARKHFGEFARVD